MSNPYIKKSFFVCFWSVCQFGDKKGANKNFVSWGSSITVAGREGRFRGTGRGCRAAPAAAHGRDDAGADGAVVGAGGGHSPALSPGCGRRARLGQEKEPSRQGGAREQAGLGTFRVYFLFLFFSHIFFFSLSHPRLGCLEPPGPENSRVTPEIKAAASRGQPG